MELRFAQIIISYNQKEVLPRAIDSVLAQSVVPDEIIIGDDGSTDGSQEIIDSYAEDNPHLIRTVYADRTMGTAHNMNSCVEHTDAELVSFLAGDDELLPRKFATQFEVIRLHWDDYKVFYSDNYTILHTTGKRELWSNRIAEGNVFSELVRRRFSMRNYWLSRQLFTEIGGFDEELELYEDWKMKLELALHTHFKYCPGIFSVYHTNPKGVSSRPPQEHLNSIRRICRSLAEKYDLNRRELRHLRAVELHYEMMAQSGSLARIPYSLRMVLKDPAWLKPHAEIVKRFISRRMGRTGISFKE